MAFGYCHVTIRYKEILSFFDHCYVTFPYMEPLSFYGRFVQKVIVYCFSDSVYQFLSQNSDGSQYATINPQLLRKNFRKKVSSFLQLHMKNTLFVKTTASPITTKRRVFYPLVNIILYYLETFKSY